MKRLSGKSFVIVVILAGAAWACLLMWLRIRCRMYEGVYVLSFQQEERFFSQEDMQNIRREGIDLTFVQSVRPRVFNGFRREEAEVFLTNENYAYIANAHMREGAFFNEIQVDKRLPVAVLNETAALRLFGNQDCVGETVYLENTAYQVVGIMEGQEPESAMIYVPCSTMECLGVTEMKAGQLWCRFSNRAEAQLVMKKTGCPLEELVVLQMDHVKDIFWLRFALLLILPGAYGILHMFRKETEKWKSVRNSGEIKAGKILRGILRGLIMCAGVLLLWKLAAGSWCAPPASRPLGGGWKATAYGILDFYLLVDVRIDNMSCFTHWNVLSLLSVMVYLYFFYHTTM